MIRDPSHYHIDYTAIPKTQTILWREGWGDTINRNATMIYDFRERKIRDALIELGWKPPVDNPARIWDDVTKSWRKP